MSAGSRSIASARQRRAGDPPPISQQGPPPSRGMGMSSQQFLAQQKQPPQQQYQQQQQQQQQQQYQQPQQQSPNSFVQRQVAPPPNISLPTGGIQSGPEQIGSGPGKLSVSDAFALVTLRLGKLETLVNKWQNEGYLKTPGEMATSNNGFQQQQPQQQQQQQQINDSIQTSVSRIVSRLERLESQPQTVQTIQQDDSLSIKTDELKQQLEDKIQLLQKEMDETKHILLKLQSFTMETNQKLVDVILAEAPSSSMNDPMSMMMSMMMGSQSNPHSNIHVNEEEEDIDVIRDIEELHDTVEELNPPNEAFTFFSKKENISTENVEDSIGPM